MNEVPCQSTLPTERLQNEFLFYRCYLEPREQFPTRQCLAVNPVYFIFNAYWEPLDFELPPVDKGNGGSWLVEFHAVPTLYACGEPLRQGHSLLLRANVSGYFSVGKPARPPSIQHC